jgi:PAS domain S-box-containing protein
MSSHSEQPALDDNLAYMITRTNKAEIAYANPSFARATGYTIDEIIGSPFIRYLDRDSLDRGQRYLRNGAGRRTLGRRARRASSRRLVHLDAHQHFAMA